MAYGIFGVAFITWQLAHVERFKSHFFPYEMNLNLGDKLRSRDISRRNQVKVDAQTVGHL